MTTALLHNAMTETYNDVKDLIHSTVHKFIDKYGLAYGDYEELFAQANWEFMIAFKDHKRKDGNRTSDASFPTWCQWVVMKGLLEHQRNFIRRNQRCRFVSINATETDPPATLSKFNLNEFLDELSADAKMVVRLVVEMPEEIAGLLRDRGPTERNTKAGIRQYLSDLGWDKLRIADSFDEITQGL